MGPSVKSSSGLLESSCKCSRTGFCWYELQNPHLALHTTSPFLACVWQSLPISREAKRCDAPGLLRAKAIQEKMHLNAEAEVQEGPLVSTLLLLRSTRVEGEQVIRCSTEGLDAGAADRVELSQKN